MECVGCALRTVTESVLTLMSGFLAEALDVFILTIIAPKGRSPHLGIVGGKLNGWMDGLILGSEPGETVTELANSPFVVTIP